MLFILITKKQASSVGGGAIGKPLGTWVRIPGPPPFLILFSIPSSYAARTPGVHHTPIIHTCHMATEGNPKVEIWGAPCALVNESTRDHLKSTRPWDKLAWLLAKDLQFGDRTPHWFALSSFFVFFLLLFVLINFNLIL